MLQHNKILLIGLPRCGSQYISEIITTNFRYLNLLEPFTPGHDYSIQWDNEKVFICPKKNFANFDDQCIYTFSVLNRVSEKSRVILKYFPHVNDEKYTNKIIVDKLISNGFVPIIVKRDNLEHHLISWLMAVNTNKWFNTDINFKREKIEIKKFDTLDWFALIYKEFNTLLSCWPIIRYETAQKDICEIFSVTGLKKQYKFIKMSPNNPYDDIINSDETKKIVDKYVKIITN